MKLLDSSAWVEYFKGTPTGSNVKKILEEGAATSAISLAEIAKWAQENGAEVIPIITQMKKNAIVISLEEPILIESGKQYIRLRKIQKSIGMIDVIIYITALIHGLQLITTDNDFRGLPETEFLK